MTRSAADRMGDIVVALDRIERRVQSAGIKASEDLDDESLAILAWSLLIVGEAIKALPADLTAVTVASTGAVSLGCGTSRLTSTFASTR